MANNGLNDELAHENGFIQVSKPSETLDHAGDLGAMEDIAETKGVGDIDMSIFRALPIRGEDAQGADGTIISKDGVNDKNSGDKLEDEGDYPEPTKDEVDELNEPWFAEASKVIEGLDGGSEFVKQIAKKAPVATGMNSEPLDLYEGPSMCSCCINWVKEHPDDVKESLEATDEVRQHAVLVRRKKSHRRYNRDPLEIDSIVIHSPLIKDVLTTVFEGYPAIDLDSANLTFLAPFQSFFHRWSKLQEAIAAANESETAAKDQSTAAGDDHKLTEDISKASYDDSKAAGVNGTPVEVNSKAEEVNSKAIENGNTAAHDIDTPTSYSSLASKSNDTAAHLKTLYDILAPELEEPMTKSKALLEQNLIAFELVWTLFKPGELIYVPETPMGDESLFELESCTIDKDDKSGPVWILNCSMIDWDGKGFGYASYSSKIKYFDASKRIEELPAYPLEHHSAIDEVKRRCIKRGRRFEELAGVHYVAYRGIAFHRRKYKDIFDYNTESLLDETFVIDAETYHREGTDKPYLKPLNRSAPRPSALMYHGIVEENMDRNDEPAPKLDPLTDDQCLVCSPWVAGYALKSKKWTTVLIRNVQEIVWNEAAFENLVLPQDYKELILGFVEGQLNKAKGKTFDDLIAGEGGGMIMLLSGPPGVGKTLTAESVAEKLHAPLYSVTAGQLGVDAAMVEERLMDVLQLAKKWNSVLLLDEADVFLEQRTIHHLERNRLVAVFLRTLEYYDGVLFLTTNRLSDIDSAFESRVDFHIEYPDLGSSSRRDIWKNLLARGDRPVDLSSDDYEKLAKHDLNGRRIKNIIKSAHLIATRHEKSTLTMEDIEKVLNVVQKRSVIL